MSHEVKHEGSCMSSGNQVRPAVEVVPSRVVTQTSSPAPVVVERKAPIVVEQKGVSPSPKRAFNMPERRLGGLSSRGNNPGFAEDVSFPQRIQFDDRSVPCGGAKNRWVDAMLGRTGYISSSHVVESTTGTLIAPAPTEAVSAALPTTFAQIRSPDHPVAFGEACASHSEHRQGEYAPSHIMPPSGAAASGDGGNQNPSGNNVGDGWHHVDPSHNPVPSPPSGPPEAHLEEAVVVDPARLVARLEVLLVEVEAEVITLMIMACFLPICAQPVLLLRMRSCVRDAAITAPVHPHETACLVSTDVVRFVALIQCVFAKCALSGLPEIPSLEGQEQIAGRQMARTSGKTTKRPSARVSLLRRSLLPISSVLG